MATWTVNLIPKLFASISFANANWANFFFAESGHEIVEALDTLDDDPELAQIVYSRFESKYVCFLLGFFDAITYARNYSKQELVNYCCEHLKIGETEAEIIGTDF